jgi:hypothetical protein
MPTQILVLRGTKHYGAHAAHHAGRLIFGARVELVPEVGNPHDANAMYARLSATGQKLGYINRDIVVRYRHLVLKGAVRAASIHEAEWKKWSDGTPRLRVSIAVVYEDAATAKGTSSGIRNSSVPNDVDAVPGVYAIVNDRVSRSYIGASRNVKARVRKHLHDLGSGVHHNPVMQRDYTSQRGDGFRVQVLFRIHHVHLLADAEERAIAAALAAKQKLYNLTNDGQGSRAARFSQVGDAEEVATVSDREIIDDLDEWGDLPPAAQPHPRVETDDPTQHDKRRARSPQSPWSVDHIGWGIIVALVLILLLFR